MPPKKSDAQKSQLQNQPSPNKTDSKQHPRLIPVAVVGAGYWGPNIIRNLGENTAFSLDVVCDMDEAKLTRVKNTTQHEIRCVTNFQDVIDDPKIEAVAVVTGIRSHFPLVKQALEAGKHVFVEKPLATTPKECLQLGVLAEQAQKILMVGHTFVYNPAVDKLKEILRSGILGDLFYMHAQRLNLGRVQTDINSLWSLGVHDISIALHLFEELPTVVRSWGHAFLTPGIEDVVFLSLQFPSGRLAHIHVSWLDPEKRRQVTLVGKRKMVVYDDVSIDRKITIYDKGLEEVEHCRLKEVKFPEYKDFSGFQYLTRSGDVQIPHLNFQEPLKVEMQHFAECIINARNGIQSEPKTSWIKGYEVVKTLEASQESLQHGGIPVEIDWSKHPQQHQSQGKSTHARL